MLPLEDFLGSRTEWMLGSTPDRGSLVLLRGVALAALGGLLGEQNGVDVGEHAARGNGDAAEELVELLVVADREHQVAWRDALLLVVTARVARELEHLSRHVLDDGGEVDGATGAVALGEAHVAQVLADARHREGEASLGRLGDRLRRRRERAGGTAGRATQMYRCAGMCL